jgi:hypothetical protein
MNSSTKLALAALTGLFAAGASASAFASTADAGQGVAKVSTLKLADAGEKHACKGLNSCKGQGADHKNACKGKGSCRTDGGTPPT